MFVSALPQISADAISTDTIGTTGPLIQGSNGADGGFASWLLSSGAPISQALEGANTSHQLLAATLLPLPAAPLPGNTEFIADAVPASDTLLDPDNKAPTQTALTAKLNSAGVAITPEGLPPQAGETESQTVLAKPALSVSDHSKQGSLLPNPAEHASSGVKGDTFLASIASLQAKLGGEKQSAQSTLAQALPSKEVPTTSSLPQQVTATTAATPQVIEAVVPQSDIPSQTPQQNTAAFNPLGSVGHAGLATKTISQADQTGSGKSTQSPVLNTADIAVQMARNKTEGSNQFTIRLTPESMGTITIRLNVAENAQLTAQMQVEKPETLALLQKDLAGLEKALKAQGFSTSDGDLTVALKSAGNAARAVETAANSLMDQRPGQGQNGSQNQAGNQSSSNGQASGGQVTSQQAGSSNAMDRPAANSQLSSGDMGFQQSPQDRGSPSHMASEQGFQGYPDQMEADENEVADMEVSDLVANAYKARSMMIGMSSQVDLSI